MDNNIVRRFKFQQYQEHLSPFGKKVLKVLVNQWKTEREHRINEYQRREITTQSRRVISFNDSHPQSTETEKPFNFNLIENNFPDIPRSVELVETVQAIQEQSYKDDLVVPLNTNLGNDIYNKLSDDEEPFDFIKPREVKKTNNIDWNDMFDSEIFPQVTANTNFANEIVFENQTFQQNDDYAHRSNVGEYSKMKIPKRKNQTKVTDAIPKKIKKNRTNEDPNERSKDNISNVSKKLDSVNFIKVAVDAKTTKYAFRKQTYTKTVNNWLNNVYPNNPVKEEIIITNDNPDTDCKKQESDSGRDKKSTQKKIIQAQLANKDGVMKFSKPKNVKTANIIENESKVAEIENNKEKKVKKCVAPIKSQIRIKDVVFEVRDVDLDQCQKLLDVKDKEIYVTLIYSNSFSQLNNQHTDDTCVPDGVLFNNDEVFYWCNGTNLEFVKILNDVLRNDKIICYDGKTFLIYLATQLQIEINDLQIYDAQIGGSLLEPDNPPENFSELQKLLCFAPQFTVATECRLQKAAWYLTLLRECWSALSQQLMENSLWSVFVDIEMRLVPIVANMERRGIKVDLEKLRSMEETLLGRMRQVEQQCYQAAGKVFQINSVAQVGAIIYEELQLDAKCNVKIRETIGRGAKSTSEAMLRSLVSVHPLPKLVLEYRHLHKAHATFLAGIAHHVKNGVVRPTWVQMAAATGRIAANNPNLQAIPKAPFSLVLFPGPEDKEPQQLNFRSVYVSREGCVLLAADFKHVECRVFAHAAADTGLLDALASGDDLFRVLAAKWLNKAAADVSSSDRERTKRIVYAGLYGAGARKLMDLLQVSYEQALTVIASFNNTFPALKSFGRSVVARCERSAGRLETLCGRARRFNNISSQDFAQRAQAERQAVNFVVQGSAADICKIAMILTEEQLRASWPPLHAHLLLQLHDELVWEVPRQHLDRAAELIKRVMEGCGRRCGLGAALPVAVSAGASWGRLAHYHPPSSSTPTKY